jgi:hypothetical protein
MADWKRITPADLGMLPAGCQQRIPESYLDDFKHMNVIWWAFRDKFGSRN